MTDESVQVKTATSTQPATFAYPLPDVNDLITVYVGVKVETLAAQLKLTTELPGAATKPVGAVGALTIPVREGATPPLCVHEDIKNNTNAKMRYVIFIC